MGLEPGSLVTPYMAARSPPRTWPPPSRTSSEAQKCSVSAPTTILC